jgi:hypothetical protein
MDKKKYQTIEKLKKEHDEKEIPPKSKEKSNHTFSENSYQEANASIKFSLWRNQRSLQRRIIETIWNWYQ